MEVGLLLLECSYDPSRHTHQTGRYSSRHSRHRSRILRPTKTTRTEGVIDALSIASATNQPNLQWYGYHGGRLLGFPKEYLIPNGIPEEAVIAWIPALGRPCEIPIHLGTMEIPEALVVDAGGSSDFKIWEWAEDEIYTRTGVRSVQMVQRLMRALCVEASDYDVGQ